MPFARNTYRGNFRARSFRRRSVVTESISQGVGEYKFELLFVEEVRSKMPAQTAATEPQFKRRRLPSTRGNRNAPLPPASFTLRHQFERKCSGQRSRQGETVFIEHAEIIPGSAGGPGFVYLAIWNGSGTPRVISTISASGYSEIQVAQIKSEQTLHEE